ncbi:MAG: hypothetical protein BSOLF_1772 [Candidatus Carbobacillus altaicus]|uniref:Uncharacterized protein n=1 Tax=Candidatus Carbonibacillus altaicus TaxID=2163959 RepID=A0A2R6XYW7_9BACL|nr:MAG: hypothetical protein BSOLF_1772 [Candidatus Carbobacillus altaicus]
MAMDSGRPFGRLYIDRIGMQHAEAGRVQRKLRLRRFRFSHGVP